MAYSRTFLLLSLLFAIILVISSDVSARELAETGQTGGVQVESTGAVHEQRHGGGGHYGGGGHHGGGHYGGGGGHGCKWGKCCKGPHCHGANAETDANHN